MIPDWLLRRMADWADREAVASGARAARYGDLAAGIARWRGAMAEAGVGPGRVVAFDGDYSEVTVTLLLALIDRGCIAVPLGVGNEAQKAAFLEISQAEFLVGCQGEEGFQPLGGRGRAGHPLLEGLASAGRPGLVLFSSGSTGEPKAILHDLLKLLQKFEAPRPGHRILSFLLLDHIGGLNTLFHGLSCGGTVVFVPGRSPATVCREIARHRVEVLPATPTFLNLLLVSGEHRRHDLTSLRLITYGTEVMPASTLERLHEQLPGVRFQQTYGLSELGILRSKSREDGSLWVKVGGEGYETKVVDGVLWVRAESAMLGYLNAPDRFDPDGWFNTEDAVEQEGEWLRFLGRRSDIINVGGQKVYPAQVESVLLTMDNVEDVAVRGQPNPLLGNCVVARVRLRAPEPPLEVKSRMLRHCQGKLAPFMIPVRVEITDSCLSSARGKRVREG